MAVDKGIDEGYKQDGLADRLSSSELAGNDVELDPAKIKKIVRKLDLRVLPCLVVMYFMNYLDRQNVAAARLKGLQTELGLTGLQYSNVINLFFVTYVGCQIPANYLLAFVKKPTWYICTMMALWGLVSLLVAVVNNYAQLLAVRLVLGVLEAVFYPGALFTLSKFYTRSELALRSAFFYGAALLASAFGSLFAAGVIAGIGPTRNGISGWRYLFYIEGGATIGLALIILFILPNFPSDAPFLTEEERLIAVKRLAVDVGTVDKDDDNEPWYVPLKQAFADPVIYLLGVTWWLVTAGLAFNSYSPTLTSSLGIGGSTISLLLTAPPYIYALILALVNCWHSDRVRERGFHVIAPLIPAMVGCIIPLATENKAARFVGIFLMTGAYGGYPVILGWVNVSFPGRPKRRAAAIGFLAAFANTANIAGGYFFVSSKYGPTYKVSFGLVLAMLAGGAFAAFGTKMYLVWRNKQLERAQQEGTAVGNANLVEQTAKAEGVSEQEAARMAAGFRYYT